LSYSLKHIGHTHFHTSNGAFKLAEALLEIHSSFFSHSIITWTFPLSAVTAALHYLPRCLSSTLTCGKTPTTVTSREQEQRAFHYRNTISKKSTECYCTLYLGSACSTIEIGKIFSYYLLKLKSEPFNDHASDYSGYDVFRCNSPPAAAREVSKPSTDSASLVVPSQNKFFSFGFGVLWGGCHKCFRVFMAYFTRPWTSIEWAHILAQIFLRI